MNPPKAEFLRTISKFGKREEILLSLVYFLCKTWNKAFSHGSCVQKVWCKCKIVVLVIKPIAFLTFLLLSQSSDLKVSNILTYWYLKKTVWKSELKCEEREYSKVNNGIHHWFLVYTWWVGRRWKNLKPV